MTNPKMTPSALDSAGLTTRTNTTTMFSTAKINAMHSRSNIHARKRVTGPASVCEKTTPSGVRMSRVLVRVIRAKIINDE